MRSDGYHDFGTKDPDNIVHEKSTEQSGRNTERRGADKGKDARTDRDSKEIGEEVGWGEMGEVGGSSGGGDASRQDGRQRGWMRGGGSRGREGRVFEKRCAQGYGRQIQRGEDSVQNGVEGFFEAESGGDCSDDVEEERNIERCVFEDKIRGEEEGRGEERGKQGLF